MFRDADSVETAGQSSLPDPDRDHGNVGCDSENQFSFGSFKIIADKKKIETHERQVDDGFLKKF